MRRSTPLVDQGLRIYAICGGTYAWVRDTVKTEASVRGITVSKLIGEILQEWAASYVKNTKQDLGEGDNSNTIGAFEVQKSEGVER